MARNTWNEERFTELQAAARAAAYELRTRRAALQARYQATCYAPRGAQSALASLDRKAERTARAFHTYLSQSPRDWSVGVPAWYAVESLTWADASTRGPLGTVPPAAWGYTDRDAERFAASLE
jgi:hypothetical protein